MKKKLGRNSLRIEALEGVKTKERGQHGKQSLVNLFELFIISHS